jgi:hypothetical protein
MRDGAGVADTSPAAGDVGALDAIRSNLSVGPPSATCGRGCEIRAGTTMSYGGSAERVGRPQASARRHGERVESDCAHRAVPPRDPYRWCARWLGSAWCKRWLLDHESTHERL